MLLLVTVNLLLCPIYKLNFTTDMYVQKETTYEGFGTICGFGHPLGVLECIPHGWVWGGGPPGGSAIVFRRISCKD